MGFRSRFAAAIYQGRIIRSGVVGKENVGKKSKRKTNGQRSGAEIAGEKEVEFYSMADCESE